jgi:hypothetical protein
VEACKVKGGAVNRPSPTRNDEVLTPESLQRRQSDDDQGRFGDFKPCCGAETPGETEGFPPLI